MDVRIKRGQSDKHCPYCRDDLSTDTIHCNRCQTSYHSECVRQHGGCTTIGCEQGKNEPDWGYGAPTASVTPDESPMPTARELMESYDASPPWWRKINLKQLAYLIFLGIMALLAEQVWRTYMDPKSGFMTFLIIYLSIDGMIWALLAIYRWFAREFSRNDH